MKIRYLGVCGLALLLVQAPAWAGKYTGWQTVSNVGVYGLLVTSVAVPTVKGDWPGLGQAVMSDLAGEGLSRLSKAVIHEERPNHEDNKSFPSRHAVLAFAAATTLYRRYGWRAGAIAYPVATLAGVARITSRKHHWWDVVAGAAMGAGSGWLLTRPLNDKVRMSPWVGPDGGGVALSMRW